MKTSNTSGAVLLTLALMTSAWAQAAAPKSGKPARKPISPPAPVQQAASAPAEPVLQDWMLDEIDLIIERQIAPRFTMDEGLEGRLQEAGRELAAEHLLRVKTLMRSWALAALRDPDTRDRPTQTAHARIANAFALWGLDSLGTEHDDRLLKALQSRSACFRGEDGKASELEARLRRLQALPSDELELALRDERELLARWGTPRTWEAPRAPFLVGDQIRRLRAGVGQADPPLSPVLAYWFLAKDKKIQLDPDAAHPALHCALHQWALWAELDKASSQEARRDALARWREALKMDAGALLWLSAEEVGKAHSADDSYPRVARYFMVTGDVELDVELDAAGKVLDGRVAKRSVQVLGLPAGERPAAFETLLDQGSLRLLKTSSFKPGSGKQEGGRWLARQPYRWSFQ
jgi:hypothetical protein